MNKEERGIDFTRIGEPRKITRHRLRFHTRADFEEVLRRGGKDDCISFSSGDEKRLLGRIIRVAEERLTIEVEAAEDIGEAGFSHQVRWASPPGSEATTANALFAQPESECFPKYPPSYSIWDTFGFSRRRGRSAASSVLDGEYAEKMQKRLIALLTVLLVIVTLVLVPLANNYCYWHYPFTGSIKCEEEASSTE